MSSSADLLIRLSVVTRLCLLQFQMKAGSQKISENEIGIEAQKAGLSTAGNLAEWILVIVAMNLHEVSLIAQPNLLNKLLLPMPLCFPAVFVAAFGNLSEPKSCFSPIYQAPRAKFGPIWPSEPR